MDTSYIASSAGVLAPPIFGFIGNLLLRREEALKSSGTDWLLALWVFDLTAALAIDDFSKLIPGTTFKDLGVSLFIILTFLSFFSWWAVGILVEPRVRAIPKDWRDKMYQLALFAIAYSIAMTLTAFNTFIFVYRG